MVLIPADRGQPAAQMYPLCPWALLASDGAIPAAHPLQSTSTEQWAAHCGTLRHSKTDFTVQFIKLGRSAAHWPADDSMCICVLFVLSTTPEDQILKSFYMIAWPHMPNLMLMLVEVKKILAQHIVHFLLDLRWCIPNDRFGLHCMKIPRTWILLALGTKYDQWGWCEIWFCNFVNAFPNVNISVWLYLERNRCSLCRMHIFYKRNFSWVT